MYRPRIVRGSTVRPDLAITTKFKKPLNVSPVVSPRRVGVSIPKLKTQSDRFTRDLPIASPRPAQKQNFYKPPQEKIQLPKSSPPEVTKLINICCDCLFPVDQNSISMKMTSLQSLLQYINNFHFNSQITEYVVDEYMRMINLHIFRPFRPLPPQLLFSDSKVILSTRMWPQYSIVYSILGIITRKAPPDILFKHITKAFVCDLIDMIAIPDSAEAAAIGSVTYTIYERVPGYQSLIIKCMLHHIQNFLDGNAEYTIIAPVVDFLSNIFRNYSQNRGSFFAIFRTKIVPLFSKTFSAEYFDEVANCSIIFLDDPQTALWFIKYLITHFPATDTSKQCLFLQHLQLCVQFLPGQLAQYIAPQLFSIVAPCLDAPNFRVCLAALGMLRDPAFLHHFASYSAAIVRQCAPRVASAARHWCDTVRDAAQEAMSALKALNKGADRIALHSDRGKRRAAEAKVRWLRVFDAAAEAGADATGARNELEKL